jgi:hypothetical protein
MDDLATWACEQLGFFGWLRAAAPGLDPVRGRVPADHFVRGIPSIGFEIGRLTR